MSPEPALNVRADLTAVSPYVSPQQPARFRMNTNESPYAPPPELVQEVAREIEHVALNRYPDRDANRLFDAMSEHLGWPRDGLWIANGSNEVFMHLFLAFGGPGRSTMLFEPTYALHALIPSIASTRVAALERSDDFTIDLDAAVDAIRAQRPEIVIVCSPNNPTGGCEAVRSVEVLLAEAPGLVVVDEAYIEFARPEDSVRSLLAAHENLVVVKTFSKAWRLAGVRIGYMLAHPALISELARVRLPYHLSAITQVVGEAALRHADQTLELVRSIAEERDRIALELQAMGVMTFPSRANFVLFEIDDPPEVWRRLLDRGVLVRSYPEHPRLNRCLRVTAGLSEETDAFLGAMREIAG
ncbi:MAG TPA: histidinol-phosphate transaminase [Actinomycetota bacterium]|nr:histidinol-phosphate transaminase [Actinomycetota bacterium]